MQDVHGDREDQVSIPSNARKHILEGTASSDKEQLNGGGKVCNQRLPIVRSTIFNWSLKTEPSLRTLVSGKSARPDLSSERRSTSLCNQIARYFASSVPTVEPGVCSSLQGSRVHEPASFLLASLNRLCISHPKRPPPPLREFHSFQKPYPGYCVRFPRVA